MSIDSKKKPIKNSATKNEISAQKFVAAMKNLREFYVVPHDKKNCLVFTKIIIKEHKTILGHIFMPHSKNVDKEFPVCFLVNIEDIKCEIYRHFQSHKLPILIINKSQEIREDILLRILDNFIKKTFYDN